MKKGCLIAAVSVTLMLGIALAPAADAFGGRGGGGAFGGRSSGVHRPGFKRGPGFVTGFNGFQPGFSGGYNRSFPGLDGFGPGFKGFSGFRGFNQGFKGDNGVGWFAPWGSTTVYYGGYGDGWPGPMSYPATYYAPEYYAPVNAAPPLYAPQMGGSIAVAPVPPAPSSVVVFPGGRYELRGDGVTAPFQWVWIPNPPPGPPAPPTAPPATPEPGPGGQSPSASAPAARTQLYRWTDEQDVVHWTNRAEAVPAKYRKQAKYNPDE